jgi:2-polyprenyl-6-methoxyphenol hydroxylase-like FAD-dependent oxidoreductase
MTRSTSTNAHAIVLGASMAGLLTARVLSEHFDRVTLIERDPVANHPEARKGQPQTRHLHGLLASGLELMSRYYPDLVAALEAGGAIVGDFGENMRWHTYGGYRQRFTLGSKAALMSRPFLEYLIRVRTLAQANITLIDNCAVRRLMTTIDLTRIVGVEVEHRDREGAMEAFAAGE